MAQGSERFATGFSRRRGRNGRWRAALTEEDLEPYARTASRVFEPSCRTWLEERA